VSERDRKIADALVRGVQGPNGSVIIDRTKPFDGTCEGCGKVDDLRPYGRGGKWVCCDCGEKDPEAMNSRMGHVLLGFPLKEGT